MNFGYARFLRDIDQVARQKVVLLTGDDVELKREAYFLLRERLGKGIEVTHLGESKPVKLFVVEDALSEVPMIGSRRLVVTWNVDKIGLKEWAEASKNTEPDVMSYGVTDEDVDHKDLIVDASVVCDSINAGTKEFDRFLDHYLNQYGKRLSDDARKYINDVFVSKTHAVPRELLKVALYVGDRHEIVRDDLVQALWSHRTQRVYDLVDCIIKKDLPMAMRLWEETWQDGAEPTLIFHLLSQRVQWIEGAIRAQDTGEGLKDYIKRRKIPFHLMGKLIEGLKFVKRQYLMKYIDLLCEAEARVRRSDIGYQRHIVDKTIVVLCT